MNTPGAPEPRYAPSSSRCEGDEERRLPVRPPKLYKPPCNSHPHLPVSSGYRQHPSASPFNRAALERSSIWIWFWTGPWLWPHSGIKDNLNSFENRRMLHDCVVAYVAWHSLMFCHSWIVTFLVLSQYNIALIASGLWCLETRKRKVSVSGLATLEGSWL